ncbi:hypothetical protein ES708_32920 [subsurface metagenome]
MSGDHPKLILDGTKTMTRRVIVPQPPTLEDGSLLFSWRNMPQVHSPYGQVGDRLWVRETHYRYGHWNKNGLTKTGRQKWTFKPDREVVRFTDDIPIVVSQGKKYVGWYKRPSIFMPRWASRIMLEITELRVERVQEIGVEDCLAEGLLTEFHSGDIDGMSLVHSDLLGQFHNLWDSLNAKRGYGWDTNPWVWVIGFKLLEPDDA